MRKPIREINGILLFLILALLTSTAYRLDTKQKVANTKDRLHLEIEIHKAEVYFSLKNNTSRRIDFIDSIGFVVDKERSIPEFVWIELWASNGERLSETDISSNGLWSPGLLSSEAYMTPPVYSTDTIPESSPFLTLQKSKIYKIQPKEALARKYPLETFFWGLDRYLTAEQIKKIHRARLTARIYHLDGKVPVFNVFRSAMFRFTGSASDS